jgi:hypothetical protein
VKGLPRLQKDGATRELAMFNPAIDRLLDCDVVALRADDGPEKRSRGITNAICYVPRGVIESPFFAEKV